MNVLRCQVLALDMYESGFLSFIRVFIKAAVDKKRKRKKQGTTQSAFLFIRR